MLLDSSVLIDVLRGSPAAHRLRSLRSTGERLHVCAVNVEEVVRGLRPDEEASVARLFAGLRTVPLRQGEGRQAGEWRREFASRGITLSQADCLVAAAALTAGGRLATGNPRHFPMPELTVEHWPVGA